MNANKLFAAAFDFEKNLLYYVLEERNEVETLVTVLNFIETERLAFWYDEILDDEDAEEVINMQTEVAFLANINRIIWEEKAGGVRN